jgi:hypothetical protein
MPDLEKQKQEFLTLCRENIKRDGLEDLLGWLQKSDFFTAPASTRSPSRRHRRVAAMFTAVNAHSAAT